MALTPPKPADRRIRIGVRIQDHSGGSYSVVDLGTAEINANLPVSLRALMAQVEAAIRQTSAAVVALHGPVTPPAAPEPPADVALGDEPAASPTETPATPADDLDDLPF